MKVTPILAPQHAANAPDAMRHMKMETKFSPLTLEDATQYESSDQKPPISNSSESSATVEATQPLSPQFAELAKRRRSLQVKERELAEKEKALLTKTATGNAVDVERLKSEPLRVLLENGVTYDQLTEAILANQGDREIWGLKTEMKSLKEDFEKKLEEQSQKGLQQEYAERHRQAKHLVENDPRFELVKKSRALPDVMRLIEQTYKQDGEKLSAETALQLVEDELLTVVGDLAMSEKVRSKYSPAPQNQVQQARPQMRTLTNKDTASPIMSAKQRAMAAFYGTLKK